MKSYRGLTFRYLKKQKKRTMLTIFGVILSIALITSIGTMLESLQYQSIEAVKQSVGFYHTKFLNINENSMTYLKNNPALEKAGFGTEAGIAKVSKDSYILVSGYSSDLMDIMGMKTVQGRLPQNSNEIAVEKWVLSEMPGKPELGDMITLNLEDKTVDEVESEIYNQSGNKVQKAKTIKWQFKIVGILPDDGNSKMMSMAKGIVIPKTVEAIKGSSDLTGTAYIRVKSGLPVQENLQKIEKELNIPSGNIKDNNELLSMIGQSKNKTNNSTLYELIAFLLVLIITATAAVIYNSFHISVLERIRQFGILRSIGTTPKQIMEIVLGEALVIALIALPLGLISGILAVKILIGIFSRIGAGSMGDIKVIIVPLVLYISSGVGITSVLLSALSPAFLAGRVSPLQAIMNNKSDKRAPRAKGKHRILRKLFGISGGMAFNNIKRNRKRFYVTVFSMCIGIVIFIVFNTLIYYSYQGTHGNDAFLADYELQYQPNPNSQGFTEKDFNALSSIKGVEKVYKNENADSAVTFQTKDLSPDFVDYIKKSGGSAIKSIGNTEYFQPFNSTTLWGYDSMELMQSKQYLTRGTLDEKTLNNENGVIVVENAQIVRPEDNKESIIKAANLKVGDYIYIDTKDVENDLTKAQGKEVFSSYKRLKVAGIIDKVPFNYPYPYGNIALITSENVFKNITGSNYYQSFSIMVDKNADKTAIKNAIQSISEKSSLLDTGEEAHEENTREISMKILMYGFVSVIGLIGVLNIINTISTNLILRIREFGTLRAVGMTMSQMKRMIVLEGTLYGVIGAIWGSLIGTFLAYQLFRIIIRVRGMIWAAPVNAIIGASLGTIIVTLLATLVPLRRVSEVNIIEAIGREE